MPLLCVVYAYVSSFFPKVSPTGIGPRLSVIVSTNANLRGGNVYDAACKNI